MDQHSVSYSTNEQLLHHYLIHLSCHLINPSLRTRTVLVWYTLMWERYCLQWYSDISFYFKQTLCPMWDLNSWDQESQALLNETARCPLIYHLRSPIKKRAKFGMSWYILHGSFSLLSFIGLFLSRFVLLFTESPVCFPALAFALQPHFWPRHWSGMSICFYSVGTSPFSTKLAQTPSPQSPYLHLYTLIYRMSENEEALVALIGLLSR